MLTPEISKDQSRIDIDFVHAFLTDSYWAKGRSKEDVEQSIRNAVCYGMYMDNRQIGFARVVTDTVVFAYLMDVFIDPEYRGRGYGFELVDFILNDPALIKVQTWRLATSDAHGLYHKFGFQPLADPAKMMELKRQL
jgi:GNAT superfamily N-acetyltransferase